jgi:predicted  nucleic acid-binding Zn-ribbon protein
MCLALTGLAAPSKATPPGPPPAPASATAQADNSDIVTLKTLLTKQIELREAIKAKRAERDSLQTTEERAAANQELEKLRTRLADTQRDFEAIATAVDLNEFYSRPEEKLDWKKEINSLLNPLVSQLKKMTDRPRQIERLRSEISFRENQLKSVKTSLTNLDKMMARMALKDDELLSELSQLNQIWQQRQKQLTDEMRVDHYQLTELLKQRRSLKESSQALMQSFLKSRGRNLIFSILAFALVFLSMRYLHKGIYQISPFHRKRGRTFIVRIFDVTYHTATALAAAGALLLVLYMSGDWLLLSLALIFIFGLAWTAKTGLPRYWRQVQLILNLGTVREGERIVYRDVPWRVISINIYSQLENPCLSPRILRVPLGELMDLNSRTFSPSEPWFPSKMNDWVILSDGTRGQVISQTPEMVQLKLRGGSVKTYASSNYLGMDPLNISENFRLKIIFGFDYAHQAIITDHIPALLSDFLNENMGAGTYANDLIQLKVEVEAAGASSLDLAIIADFKGRAAANYNAIARLIQKLTIEAANMYQWNIPFPQVTVHYADKSASNQ